MVARPTSERTPTRAIDRRRRDGEACFKECLLTNEKADREFDAFSEAKISRRETHAMPANPTPQAERPWK
jgi:hypothetical protein